MNSTGVKTLAAVSSLDLALPPSSTSSALAMSEDVPMLVPLVVPALVTLDLMVASSPTPTSTTIVKTPAVTTTLDYPLLKVTVEVPTVSASKVLYLLALPLLLKPLSVSSSLAVVLATKRS